MDNLNKSNHIWTMCDSAEFFFVFLMPNGQSRFRGYYTVGWYTMEANPLRKCICIFINQQQIKTRPCHLLVFFMNRKFTDQIYKYYLCLEKNI